jgi:N-acetyl-alpha-D-glucosaminyl L-malate synthase BshA
VSDYPLFDFQPYETELTSKIVDVVRHEKLDVLHVHYAIPHASAAFMAKMILRSQGIEIPFVTTLHGTDITLVGKDPSFEPVITFCINESDAVTAVSESLRKSTFEHFKVNREIEVVPNFIVPNMDTTRVNEEMRSKYATKNEVILCHISNFRKVKRVEDVIQVFAKVNTKIKSKLILVGDGPERYHCEKLARELNLTDRIIFLGKLRDTVHVLQIADVFLLPSETESFGLAALEAMAESVPVISSNTGGISEVNEHGYSGFLSDVGDVDDMVKNTLFLLEPETLKQFKINALERSKHFSLVNILPKYEAIYRKLVSKKIKV